MAGNGRKHIFESLKLCMLFASMINKVLLEFIRARGIPKAVMKCVMTFLALFGILMGVNLRGLETLTVCSSLHAPIQCHTCEHSETLPTDNDGPPKHHHHHQCCIHALPVVVECDSAILLPVSVSATLNLRPESDVIPEAPSLSAEKPPLI